HYLKEEHGPRSETRLLERLRAGLGLDIDAIGTRIVGPGRVVVTLRMRGVEKPVSAAALSDGQLQYLAYAVLAELAHTQSVLAVDEPESHMNPRLVVRILWMLEELARSYPVIVATHSDALLDALSDPARSVVLCELDAERQTRLSRVDPDALAAWL